MEFFSGLFDLIISISATIIGIGLIFAWVFIKYKDTIKEDPRIRRAVFSFFEFQDYVNLVRDNFSKLSDQKEKIQSVISGSMGKDHTEVLKEFNEQYEELDNIMKEYLKKQAELEKKLFGEMGV